MATIFTRDLEERGAAFERAEVNSLVRLSPTINYLSGYCIEPTKSYYFKRLEGDQVVVTSNKNDPPDISIGHSFQIPLNDAFLLGDYAWEIRLIRESRIALAKVREVGKRLESAIDITQESVRSLLWSRSQPEEWDDLQEARDFLAEKLAKIDAELEKGREDE